MIRKDDPYLLKKMIPHFTCAGIPLLLFPLDISERDQTNGWTHYSFANEQVDGSLRYLAGVHGQVTALKLRTSGHAVLRAELDASRKKLVVVLGNSVTVQSADKKPQAMHDRSARFFTRDGTALTFEFPLPGAMLLVIIEYDGMISASGPFHEMETDNGVTMKKDALDLLGTLLFDPIVGDRPVLGDEMIRLLSAALLHEQSDDPGQKPVSMADIEWFYREKAKLIKRALLIGSTEETIKASHLENIFRFRTLLKKCYGLTILELITEYRMAEAVRQLKDPEKTIKYIAAYTGFRSTNYFTRSFRNYFGITPKRFRDMQ